MLVCPPRSTAQRETNFLTASLESERAISYSPVAQQARYGMRLPVSLSVCETHIRILTVSYQLDILGYFLILFVASLAAYLARPRVSCKRDHTTRRHWRCI